jgi:hypothetical protein
MGRAAGKDTSSHRLILHTWGRPPTNVREQRRLRRMSGRCPNGDRLLHFVTRSRPLVHGQTGRPLTSVVGKDTSISSMPVAVVGLKLRPSVLCCLGAAKITQALSSPKGTATY